jgi:toxin FitB
MADVAIDTDVASRLQKGTEPAWVRTHIVGARTWLTFITVGELSKWAQVRGWGEVRRARLDGWIAARPIIPYDREIATVWGRLTPTAERHMGRGVLHPSRSPAADAQPQRLC